MSETADRLRDLADEFERAQGAGNKAAMRRVGTELDLLDRRSDRMTEAERSTLYSLGGTVALVLRGLDRP